MHRTAPLLEREVRRRVVELRWSLRWLNIMRPALRGWRLRGREVWLTTRYRRL